jgi:hypothetical protein
MSIIFVMSYRMSIIIIIIIIIIIYWCVCVCVKGKTYIQTHTYIYIHKHTHMHTYIHSIDPLDCHKTIGCGTCHKHIKILHCKIFTQSYTSVIHIICTCEKFIHRVKGVCI